MFTVVYDRKGEHGFVPNLVSKETIVPKSKDWWDLCIQPPYSYEFRFLRYLDVEGIPYQEMLASDYSGGQGIYPINLNIWDRTIDYFELMDPDTLQKVRQNALTIVFYYSEGDDPHLDINPHLTILCDQYSVPRDRVKVVCANGLVTQMPNYHYVPDDELYYRYLHLKDSTYVKELNLNPRTKKFTLLNRMDKPFRRLFAGSLHYHGYTNDAYFSYTNQNYSTLNVEEQKDPVYGWHKWFTKTKMILDNFNMHLPIYADYLTDDKHNDHKHIEHKFYNDAYWHVVAETHFANWTVFLTEKTFKPILNLQPFIILGPPGSLELLREMGYKTFGKWINEDYDKVANDEKRMYYVFKLVWQIATLDHEKHIQLQKLMEPTLRHNQELLLSTKSETLIKCIQAITH
jgi:hypothetical protein